jgi:cathepsin L
MSLGATTLLCLLAVAFAAPMVDQFTTFKTNYRRQYASPELEVKRMTIFADNMKFIEEHQAKFDRKEVSFEVGVNRFADLSLEEFVVQFNGFHMSPTAKRNGSTFLTPSAMVAPKEMDWRTKGYVTPVKDQGQCGSCWSFSATGSLEGQHFKKTGKLISLSEQNLVDCSTTYGNQGCNGGWMDQAFEYIKDNGIDTESSYPYEARDGKCRFNPNNVAASVTGHHDIPEGDEDSLLAAVASVGPVSVAIDASHRSFQLYKKGVYVEPRCSSTRLDHGVLAAGYGETTDGQAYWLVKNSWAENWGDSGYIQMARNHDNMCGIATSASYPLV